MTEYNKEQLRSDLKRDEGMELRPYKDSVGVWTVGVGHNLVEHGLPLEVLIAHLQSHDMHEEQVNDLLDWGVKNIAVPALNRIFSHWRTLSEPRQRVLLNMAFNLGEDRFRRFPKFWAAVAAEDWPEAKAQMIDSHWHVQVGVRALRLEDMMLEG